MATLAAIVPKDEDTFEALDYSRFEDMAARFTGLNLTWGRRTHQVSAPARLPRGWEAEFLDQDVSRFFYKWGGGLSAVLSRLRGRYDGDLDQFLIHLVFMLAELAGVTAASEAKAKGAATVVVRRRGLNTLSLADITAIPRESVRRKLAALTERGLVTREADGLYYLGPGSDLDRFFYDLAPLFWDKARPAA